MSLRKLLAAVMVVSMVFGLVGTTVLAQDAPAEGIARLQSLGVVKGDETGNLRLEDPINRAEVMAVLVRAMGLEEYAGLLSGTQPFSDVPGPNGEFAWAVGYVAIGKNKGLTTGYEDGTFRPGNNVTYAEVAALLSRATGLKPAAAAWPQSYIKAFVDAGLVPAGVDLAAQASAPAVRGMVFLLADAAFMSVRDENGLNLYQRVFDDEAPIVSLDDASPQTTAKTAKVSGSVEGAEAAFVNGAPLELAADGSFSADLELAVGENEIVVTAVDWASNEGSATVSITRVNTPAAHIAVASSLAVAAGAEGTLDVVVHDTEGEEIEGAEVTATLDPADLGTFDVATGTFTASEKAGSGTLTLESGDVTATVAVTVNPAALAKIEVTPGNVSLAKGDIQAFAVTGYDAFGNAISGLTAAWTVTNADGSATSKAFVSSTGSFIGSEAGVYKVTATVDAFSASATAGIYGAVASVKLSGPATVVANDESEAEFTATLYDEFGNVMAGLDADGGLAITVTAGLGADAAADIEGGVATFAVTGDVGSAGLIGDISVEYDPDADTAGDELTAEAQIEVLEQVATGIKVVSQDKYLAANDNMGEAQVQFAVVDQDGVDMQDGILYDIEFVVAGNADLSDNSVTLYSDGDYAKAIVTSQAGETGTVTVTAKSEGLPSAAATLQALIAFNPAKGALSVDGDDTLTADDYLDDDELFTVVLTITDKNGVPVKVDTLAGTLTFSSEVDEINLVSPAADADNWVLLDADQLSADFEIDTAGTGKVEFTIGAQKAAAINITATDLEYTSAAVPDGGDLTGSSVGITVTPGAADYVAWTRADTEELWVPLSAPKGTLTAQVYDQADNKAPEAGVALTVTAYDGGVATDEVTLNGKAKTTTVKTAADGSATVEFVTRPYVKPYVIELTSTDVTVDAGYDEVTVNVEAQVATSMTVKVLWDDGSVFTDTLDPKGVTKTSITAGDDIIVRVQILDSFGAPISDAEMEPYLALSGPDFAVDFDGDGFPVGEFDDETIDWVWNPSAKAWDEYGTAYKALSPLTLSAELSAVSTPITKSGSIRVVPSVADTLVVAEADEDGVVTVTEGKVAPFTLRVADEYGNPISSTSTIWTVYVYNYSDPTNIELRLGTETSTLAEEFSEADQTDPDDTFTLRGSARIYILGKNATTDPAVETIEFRAWKDLDGDGKFDLATEQMLDGWVDVDID